MVYFNYDILHLKSLTSVNSEGNGPSPTLVVYALTTPITLPIAEGGNPRPVQTPPILQFDDVTYGYVPIE